eukprot:11226294-Lingulodinium_polyedra.AAC.1
MWSRGEPERVGDDIRRVLEVTRRFEAAAGWSLKLKKCRQFEHRCPQAMARSLRRRRARLRHFP